MADLALEPPRERSAPVVIDVNFAQHLSDHYIRTSFARFVKLASRLE